MCCGGSCGLFIRAGSPQMSDHHHGYGLRYKCLMEVLRVWKAWKQLSDYLFSPSTPQRSPMTYMPQYLLADHGESVKVKIDIIYHFLVDFQFCYLVRQVHPCLVKFVLFQFDYFRMQLFSLNFLLFILFLSFQGFVLFLVIFENHFLKLFLFQTLAFSVFLNFMKIVTSNFTIV